MTDRPAEFKIAVMTGVREYAEGREVELWFNESGRVVVRAYNESGYDCTSVDLYDILDWVSTGPGAGALLDNGKDHTDALGGHSRRN